MVTPTFDFKDIKRRFEHLKECMHIEDMQNQETELNMRMHDLAFWTNREEAEKITKKWNDISKTLFSIRSLEDELTYLGMLSDEEFGQDGVNAMLESSSEFKVIESGVYSFKKFSDLYKQLNDLKTVSSDDPKRIKLSNKRTYETVKVVENIINKAIYYKC